jgi:peptidoglycan/xylan/chitin deacetylase (PgdA/CDA1 family)
LTVVPWNGYRAATSLTFDDGDPSHLDVAIPELNKRKMKGTFFLIANKVERKDEWRSILKEGHEIGNHTLDHKHPKELTEKEANAQVVGARNVLQKEFGVPVDTFAYPFTEMTPDLRRWVERSSLFARGGGEHELKPTGAIDWWNLPARTTMTHYSIQTYKAWINADLKSRGWLVWIIHGLEGTPWGYEPVARKTFAQVLDALQAKDVWVGTFLEVGSYLRAQKAFETAKKKTTGNEETLSWDVPDHFPSNVILKVRVLNGGPKTELWQGKSRLQPDPKGNFSVLFDQGSLTVRR